MIEHLSQDLFKKIKTHIYLIWQIDKTRGKKAKKKWDEPSAKKCQIKLPGG